MTSSTANETEQRVKELIDRALYKGPTVTEQQLVGVENCIAQLMTQILTLKDPKIAARMKAEPSGTLFIGPPGTGKTLAARYLAGYVGVPMYQFSADELAEPEILSGVLRALAPHKAIAYIDEISILASRREWAGSREKRTLVALLNSLDSMRTAELQSQLWVIGACTPDIQLDPALYRSGRLGVMIEFAPPSGAQRRQLLDLYLAGIPNELDDAGLDRLAEAAVGATGADIHDWVRQASAEALAEDPTLNAKISYAHLEKVVARRGFIRADRPGRTPTYEVCLHEAAHATIAYHLMSADSLGHVTVGVQPGEGLTRFRGGHFQFNDDWLAHNEPNSKTWRDHVAVRLAGAASEELVLGYRRDGASNDIGQATRLIAARLEVAEPDWGPARDAIETDTAAPNSVVGSEAMRAEAWELIRTRFQECYQRTVELVSQHRGDIERVAEALFAKKTSLSAEEILAVIEAPREVAA